MISGEGKSKGMNREVGGWDMGYRVSVHEMRSIFVGVGVEERADVLWV